jgi:cytosine/adenosine deaminase-related metal-dependent hydrolase
MARSVSAVTGRGRRCAPSKDFQLLERTTVLFQGALLVTMNARRDVFRGDLLVDDGRIAAIAPTLAPPPGARVVDARRWTIIPGLIQTHMHLCQTLFRGLADDLELLDWLKQRIWPLEAGHDEDSISVSAYLGLAELLRGGTTTIVDMGTVHHTERVFEAIATSGMRAFAGKVMMDVGDEVPAPLREDTEHSLAESLALLERWDGHDGGRIRYAFCPRFAVSCSEGLLVRVRDEARKRGTMIHTHSSENRDEVELVMATCGHRNVAYFEALGMTGPRLVLAHCIHLDDAEIDILAASGTRVAHCPSSNLKLGSGIAPVPTLLARGVQVSIGADGAPCNNNLDAFAEMRLASLLQKPIFGPTSMPAPLTFELATTRGAEAVGLQDAIGSLEVGKRADLAALDLTRAHVLPATEQNIYSQLVYAARSSDVVLTMVDGRVVVEGDVVLSFDEPAVLEAVPAALTRVLRRAGVPQTVR